MPAAQDTILAELTEMIHAVLGDFADDQVVTMDTSFSADLGMESIDVIALAGRLQSRYGDTVNFAHFVAKLDLETVRELKVGQLVAHIAESLEQADEVGAGSR
ncbi:acyl carrier protein [Micromonospora sp. WMMD987]|uniref:acyl carrier protein n=1 Tax=Micromonospora TaxID=1873 RepID=UPI00249C956D|nr:acyl carrier protein [Micromonospora sp. WMMD987]WFE97718.1 acyl carrier protein [Micromonospora sp. WMMD987]